MAEQTGDNVGSGNGLWPEGTKPCLSLCLIIIGEVLWPPKENNIRESAQSTILYNEFKIVHYNLLPHLPGANELIHGIDFVYLMGTYGLCPWVKLILQKPYVDTQHVCITKFWYPKISFVNAQVCKTHYKTCNSSYVVLITLAWW